MLGDLHFTTALVLDIGVYVLVVGLVLDLVSATGAEIDRQGRVPLSSTRTATPTGDEGGAALVGGSLPGADGERRAQPQASPPPR